MKVFKVTYSSDSVKDQSFLAANGAEMMEYFNSAFPGLPQLTSTSFSYLREEMASHGITISAKEEPNPMTSLDVLAEVDPNVRYRDLQLRSFVSRALTYDTPESMEEYRDILAKINKRPIMGHEILDLIR